jgi:hypothetical protein
MAVSPWVSRATADRVWQEFSSLERIKPWLNLGHVLHVFEPVEAGNVRMSVEIGGEPRYYGGKVLVVEPAQELSFESQWDQPHDWPVPTHWTIRLTSIYSGTQVEIFHHGFERLGAAAADNLQGYEEGWDITHLKALRENVTP